MSGCITSGSRGRAPLARSRYAGLASVPLRANVSIAVPLSVPATPFGPFPLSSPPCPPVGAPPMGGRAALHPHNFASFHNSSLPSLPSTHTDFCFSQHCHTSNCCVHPSALPTSGQRRSPLVKQTSLLGVLLLQSSRHAIATHTLVLRPHVSRVCHRRLGVNRGTGCTRGGGGGTSSGRRRDWARSVSRRRTTDHFLWAPGGCFCRWLGFEKRAEHGLQRCSGRSARRIFRLYHNFWACWRTRTRRERRRWAAPEQLQPPCAPSPAPHDMCWK